MTNMKEKENRNSLAIPILYAVIFVILVFLTAALIWAATHFSMVTFGGILFTLRMPFKDSGSDFVQSFIRIAVLPTALAVIIVIVFFVLMWKKNRLDGIGRSYKVIMPFVYVAWLIGIMIGLEVKFDAVSYLRNQARKSDFIENEYVDPKQVGLVFPEKKRNLIYIFVESAETSIIDKEHGGVLDDHNYIPEMTRLLDENTEFSQNDLHKGAAVAPASGWTMAGMVAEHGGLPLKMWGYEDMNEGKKADNLMGYYKYFMPGITTLGDILYDEGYHNYFMCGSEAEFGGRKNFYEQHGKYEIFDLETAREEGKIYWTYFVWWGFEDMKLFDFAREKITMLSEEDRPFNFTMITADTHHQDGCLCELCNTDDCEERYGQVWHCASRQIASFVEWCQHQEWYDNTTIVICGDHCSMDVKFFKDLQINKHEGETTRSVYNCFINPAVQPVNNKNRKFTTMDMFPTTLAAMGVEIPGNRLALGTNLFSDKETLSEQYGYEKLFEEIDCRSDFYNEKLMYP